MAESNPSNDLPSAVWSRLEAMIRRFEEEWKGGRPPSIDDYLPADPVERQATLRELVHVDLEYRWKAGEAVAAESYLNRYPQLAVEPTISLELREAEQQFRHRFHPPSTPRLDQSPTVALSGGRPAPVAGGALEMPAIPGYEVLRELGRGGMGIVYQARDLRLQRLVALKMLLPEVSSQAAVKRFRREAEVVARLQHPHIVQIFQVGEHAERPFLALEYVDGGNLAERMADHRQPPAEAAQLLETVARAVHHAHNHGLIHRDLKPANILIANARATDSGSFAGATGQPSTANPKIADFGLVKVLENNGDQSQSGLIVGTPSYMAPEQALGKASLIGPATDVYALGAILYEILAGRPPFQGESATDTMLNVIALEPVPPHRFWPKVPRDLETICLKCLAKEPRRRYASAALLADDLTRFLAGVPILARPAGPIERLWRWARRNPATAGLAAAVLLSLAAGTAISTTFWMDALARAAQVLEEKDRAAERAREAEAQKGRADREANEARAQEQKAKDNARRADQANGEAQREKAVAQQEQRRAQRLAASLALDHGLSLCNQGQPDYGVLSLTRGLEIAPTDDANLLRTIRANLAIWRGHVHALQLDLPHPDSVSAASFSPDGKQVLTAGRDQQARLWDVGTGKVIGKPLAHDGSVSAAAFHPDGKTIATVSGFSVRIWDAGTAQMIGQPLVHKFRVDHLAYSADGRFLLTVTALSTFHLWDARTTKAIPFDPEWDDARRMPPIAALTVTPDSSTVVAGIGASVRFWDIATGNFKQDSLVHPTNVTAVAVSPDGKRLLTGGADGFARQWELSTGKPLGRPLAQQGLVRAATFSPDGKQALTAGFDGTARLWDLGTSQPIGQPLQHMDLRVASFSPDGKQVVTAGLDRSARVWGVARRNGAAEVHLDCVPSEAVASRDGKTILTWQHGKKSADLWEAGTGKRLRETAAHESTLSAATFSADGSVVATASQRGLLLEEVAMGKPVASAIHLPGMATKLAFSPDGRTLLAAVINGSTWRIYLWDVATGKPHGQTWELGDSARLSAVHAAVFSPDGKRVLLGLSDGTARQWDVAASKPVDPTFRHEAAVWAVAFSPDSSLVVTGSFDGTARVWDAATGSPRGHPLRHFSKVWAVTFTPDGRNVLTGSDDRCARLWDVTNGSLLGPPQRLDAPVLAVAFNAQEKKVLSMAWDALGSGPRMTLRSWVLPPPALEPVDHLMLWCNAATRLTIDGEGLVQLLTREQWEQARRRLDKTE